MKETFIFDSTPLIYLGKVKVLEKIKKLQTRNIIPLPVFVEVVARGKEQGKIDAFYVGSLVENKLFEVMKVQLTLTRLEENSHLDMADIEVLSLAKSLKARAILDDEEARGAADIEGILKGGSIFILFRLLKSKVITKKECRLVVDSMLKDGWRCSTEMYAFILGELEKM